MRAKLRGELSREVCAVHLYILQRLASWCLCDFIKSNMETRIQHSGWALILVILPIAKRWWTTLESSQRFRLQSAKLSSVHVAHIPSNLESLLLGNFEGSPLVEVEVGCMIRNWRLGINCDNGLGQLSRIKFRFLTVIYRHFHNKYQSGSSYTFLHLELENIKQKCDIW